MKINIGGKSIKPLPTSEKTVRPLTKLPLTDIAASSEVDATLIEDDSELKDEAAE